MLFAAAALFVRYEFEALQENLRSQAQAQLDRYFQSSSISLVGLRGVRIRDFSVAHTTADGTTVAVDASAALVLVDVMDLLAGTVTIDRIQLDRAVIRVARAQPLRLPGRSGGGAPPAPMPSPGSAPLSSSAFRIVGNRCRIELAGLLPDRSFRFNDVDFDVYRLAGSPDHSVRMTAILDEAGKLPFQARGRYAAPDDFDLELDAGAVTPALVNDLLPRPQEHVLAGAVEPRLRAYGRPGAAWTLTADAVVHGLVLARQPEGLSPASGTLHAECRYDPQARRLTVARLEVDAPELAAQARGTVDFGLETPQLAMESEVSRLPVDLLLKYLQQTPLNEYGALHLSLDEPYRATLSASGTWRSPAFTVGFRASGGALSFAPRDRKWPKADLRLGLVEGAWDSTTRLPRGTLHIAAGEVAHKESGIDARDLSGVLAIEGNSLVAYPLQARVTGNTCAARLEYDIAKQDGSLEVAGTLSTIEKTALATAIENTVLSGSASIRAKATKKGDMYDVDAFVDGTGTGIAYRWYFDKRPGMGASGRVRVAYRPKKSVRVEGDIDVAATPLHFVLTSNYVGQKYRLQTITAESDHLDVAGIGRCITIPYRISGGTGTDARYTWTRRSVENRTWESTTTCRIDEIFLEAEPTKALMHLKGVDLQVLMDKSAQPPTGRMVLAADEAYMPPLRTEWFVPVQPDPAEYPDYTPEFNHWTYTLSGNKVEVPPWKGTDFTGEGYSTPVESGLRRYSAAIDGGRIGGHFTKDRVENAYVSETRWTDVPAPYFLQYLHMSPYLTGASSGQVTYSLDRDDPNTIDGQGRFEVRDGKFSEEFLYSRLQGQGASEPMALPPSLRFSILKSDLDFKRDVVHTPNVFLQSEGISLTGGGHFITEGDMNYDIRVSIAPATAAQMPVLTQYFNVEGHRLAQQNIELAFRVTGPTGGPRGQLAGSPPASVMLVSGALEMTSEAFKVIDVPRKILVDLLKLGGGLVGATK